MDCDRNLFPPEVYWPPHLPVRDKSVDNFVNAFVDDLGYVSCGLDESFEWGYQKVAIYAKTVGGIKETKHMARQHLLGRGWLSKLGPSEDIVHPTLRNLEGDLYGSVERILKRDWRTAYSSGLGWGSSFRFFRYRLKHPSWILSNLKKGLLY
ncbi:MAG: hypothetical protein ABSA85_12275 [Terracidiphilus sp.]|jgi:hypothetical protein